MNVGDYIYFRTKTNETYPAVVKEIGKKRIKIHGDTDPYPKPIWVSPGNCTLQKEAE